MAQRKRPDLGPHIDNSPSDTTDLTRYEMPPYQFGTAVRSIRNCATTAVTQFRDVLASHVVRLRIRRTPAITGPLPAGSDQVDMQSLFVWAARIAPEDESAKRQIGQLYATCLARLGG